MAVYNYTKNYAQLREDQLVAECVAAPNSLPVTDVQRLGDGTIDVYTSVALTGPQQTTLANAVAAHNGLPAGMIYGDNLLINSSFTIDQRGNSGVAVGDAAYSMDRWIVLAEGASTTLSKLGLSRGRITQSLAGSLRCGLTQIVEAINAQPYRSNPIILQGKVRVSAACNVRFAILEFGGTADTCPRDTVNNWASTTYTPGNFFTSGVNVLAVGSIAATTVDGTFSITAAPSASMNNLYAMVWFEGAQAQNTYFEVAEFGLYSGNNLRSWSTRSYSVEELLCRRYYLRLYSLDLGQAQQPARVYGGGILYSVAMRISPTGIGLAFAVNAGNAGAVSVQNNNAFGTAFYNGANNWTTGALVTISGALDAEI